MPRSIVAPWLVALVTLAPACQRTSGGEALVTAPVTSGSAAGADAAAAPVASTSASAPAASDAPGPGGDANSAPPQFAACQADADCVTVPRVGCCHNGWLAAVNASQKDAYAQSFTCPPGRTICPMYVVRDTRVARCDAGTKLCVLVKTQQP